MSIMAVHPVPTQNRLDRCVTERLVPPSSYGRAAQLVEDAAVRLGFPARLDPAQHAAAEADHLVVEHDGNRLRVVPVDQHDARCRVRVATPQGTTPEVLHCHFCGFAYPAPVPNRPAGQCPSWCSWHVPSDDGFIHYSRTAVVHVEAFEGSAEQHDFHVSFDSSVYPGEPVDNSVRLDDQPMTPNQALQLAAALQRAAIQAGARPTDDGGYAEGYADGWYGAQRAGGAR